MIEQDTEAHVVNTTSSNGGFTPLPSSAIYATTKAAVTTVTECLWAQLRSAESNVGVSLLYPSTRTPGMLKTGIWRPGANRPQRYDRPGAPPREGKDGLAAIEQRFQSAGMDIVWAPLEEVAELCLEGIRNDTFWITVPTAGQSAKIRERAESQIERSNPDYLLGGGPISPSLARSTKS
jgi:short-subunit dehydrogenase